MSATTGPNGEISLSNLKIQPHKIDLNVYKAIRPEDYLARYLEEGVRVDGRPVPEVNGKIRGKDKGKGKADDPNWRAVSIDVGSISSASGSSLVRLGQTTVVCGIQAEIATPAMEQPDRGYIVPNIELGPLCHPNFKPGAPSDEAQIASLRLFEVLNKAESPFLPLDRLSIESGKAVWCIYVTVICINDDGNVFDAALAATIAALINTRIPPVKYMPDVEKVVTISHDQHILPLALDQLTLSFTFVYFDQSILLPDPTAFEEDVSDATVTVMLCGGFQSKDLTIMGIEQAGPASPSHDDSLQLIQSCLRQSKLRFSVLMAAIEKATNPV